MDEEIQDTDDLEVETKDEEETEEETTEEVEETEESDNQNVEEDDTDWKAEALKYKAIAERKAKQAKKAKTEPKTPGELTALDTIALVEAKVTHPDDIGEVIEYAKFKRISVADALKSNVVKTTLAEQQEERQTAEATNTSAARTASTSPSDEDLVSKASRGEDVDPEALAKARMNLKKTQSK